MSYTSAISLKYQICRVTKNKRILMKNQALGTELPGLKGKAKSPQRFTKYDVCRTSGPSIFIVFRKLMTWSRLVTMETGTIYLPLRRFSTDRIRTGLLKHTEIWGKKEELKLRNWRKNFKWRHIKAKGRKGLKKYGNSCPLISRSLLSPFSSQSMPFPSTGWPYN